MAERAVNVINPKTGEQGSVPEAKLARALATGARPMTEQEKVRLIEKRTRDADIGEQFAAQAIGNVRGFGEGVGVATDPLAVGVASAFGKGDDTRKYLAELRENHPIATGLGEAQGQVGAMVGAAEIVGPEAAAQAPSAIARIGSAAGRGLIRGGIENVVIGNTHDVNEQTLGDPDLAGQKLYTRIPKHFLVGAVAGGGLSGLGAAAGEVIAPLMAKAPAALDRQASAAIGRELGESGVAAVETGSRVRFLAGGEIPKDAAGIADVLGREQARLRGVAGATREAEIDSLKSAHATEAWQTTAKQEAGREVAAREASRSVQELKASHQSARKALEEEEARAAEALENLSSERAAHTSKLKSLATDLDKVKGAELPSPKSIIQSATERFRGEGPSLTPPSPNALRLFNEWADTFGSKYGKHGSLNFSALREVISSLDTMETRQRVVSGWGHDPEVSKAFAALKSAARDEFDRASAMTASTVSEAKSLDATRLRARGPEIETAFSQASEHHAKMQRTLVDFDRQSARELTDAERLAERSMRGYEKRAGAELRDLTKRQDAAVRSVPKAEKGTEIDPLLARARDKVRAAKTDGSAGFGGLGALLSLAHGNVGAAAMSALGGIAAQGARARGNFLAARALRFLGDQIGAVDAAIARGAARALGRGTSSAAKVAARSMVEDEEPKRKSTFEQVSKRVREAQANPLIIDQHVQSVAGQWAPNAPQIYASLHASALRSQEFLASKLPMPQKDPYSLTPHLEPDDLSDTEKHEFMEYVEALSWGPGEAYERVLDGTINEQHVEAIKTVSPPLYEQMRAEVDRQIGMLQKPLEYERAIHLGTLLEKPTDEVLDPSFQRTAMAMYAERSESEEIGPGSRPKNATSKASKSLMSTSQRVEGGE